VFNKNIELGSARQVLLWFRDERVCLPAFTFDKFGEKVVWKLPVYHSILAVLSNPVYAGAYAFGKTEARTKVINGRAHKTEGHKKLRSEWMVLIRDHHPGYISWEQYERNQMTLAENTHGKYPAQRKSGRGGRALLAGILRCRRCGRMLHVTYSGSHGEVVRYHCRGAHINHGEAWCISFGGLRPDEAIAAEILRAIGGNAIEAAIEAADRVAEQQRERRRVLMLELESAVIRRNLRQDDMKLLIPPIASLRPNLKHAGMKLWNKCASSNSSCRNTTRARSLLQYRIETPCSAWHRIFRGSGMQHQQTRH
jgi:hypothetical protein